jgi:hypothetical protein
MIGRMSHEEKLVEIRIEPVVSSGSRSRPDKVDTFVPLTSGELTAEPFRHGPHDRAHSRPE